MTHSAVSTVTGATEQQDRFGERRGGHRVRLRGKRDEKWDVAHAGGRHSGLHLYSTCTSGKAQRPTSTGRGSHADYAPTFSPAGAAGPPTSTLLGINAHF